MAKLKEIAGEVIQQCMEEMSEKELEWLAEKALEILSYEPKKKIYTPGDMVQFKSVKK